jgi:hypothetical protein
MAKGTSGHSAKVRDGANELFRAKQMMIIMKIKGYNYSRHHGYAPQEALESLYQTVSYLCRLRWGRQ